MKTGVAVAVCNFNRREVIGQSLNAVISQLPAAAPVHLVDNGSSDGSAGYVNEAFGERVTVHGLAVNTGSSGGFNLAIARAMEDDPEYVLVLDSDCVVMKETVSLLRDFLDAAPNFAAVGPKLYWPEPPGRVQELGGEIDWTAAEARGLYKGYDESLKPPLTLAGEVDYVAACCLMIRASAVELAGNMDPAFFLYFDDVEWQWRMKLKGLHIAATGEGAAFHHCGAANKRSHLSTFYHWRNRVRFFLGHCVPAETERTKNRLRSDAARAIATMRTLGAVNCAGAIGAGFADGLADLSGSKDFTGMDLSLDCSAMGAPSNCARPAAVTVGHIFEDAEVALAAHDNEVIADVYGKTLAAVELRALLPRYREEYNKILEHLSSLRDAHASPHEEGSAP